ncbi:rRNA maturation RNase YbeY [Candidatus Oleimmundimicrobium sp.]|uniref:rRNA maturation RNase YbeY n=1 Tax=Candidatus Oleimmundimicrobium sp. TaxID=3060597 RepID=UPI00271A155A|nr:rRNA maturation RNase YbeY [Candidatus Oleimmundimicrobium sp.]MDO8885844.1 rRNA maturation RNase YbeY [Candidatus Oleimmundimicrobium sp.]
MEILINNRQDRVEIDLAPLKKLAEFTLVSEEIDSSAELSIVFMDEEEIERLNLQYRGVEEPTDVLSFPLYEKMPPGKTERPLILGDVIICPTVAQRNVLEDSHSLEEELNLLLVHGILHLLGYDHVDYKDKKLMKAREKEILSKFAQNRFGAK